MSTVGIIGAGSWGVALAQLCAMKGHRTILWARRSEVATQIASSRRSPYLPDIDLDARIEATADAAALSDAGTLLSVVPVQAMRGTLAALARHIPSDTPVVTCSKGIEQITLDLPTAIIEQTLPGRPCAVLSGPSFAIDVVRGLPTAVTIAADTLEQAAALQEIVATPTFRPYPSDDLTGAQIGGALKNVLAIACGIVIARGLGESARAALIARGFAEMSRLAEAIGARRDTLAGLSGLGDLVLTCGSERSRNFTAGLRIGDPDADSTAQGVSEGSHTAEAAVALAARHDVSVPICETVAAILSGSLDVDKGIAGLLARPLRPEE